MIPKTKHIWAKIVKRILRAGVQEGLIEISRWSAEKNHQDPTNWQSLNSRLNTCVILMTQKTSAIFEEKKCTLFWVYIC